MNGPREANGTSGAATPAAPTSAGTHDARPSRPRIPAAGLSEAVPAPAARHRRAPMPPPAPAVIEDVIPVNNANSEKMQQMMHLQDFLHSSLEMDLSTATLDSSSTPEEIESHMADLRHRVGMLTALSKVLVEEIDMLEAALLRSRQKAGN
ncbi:hypothetical protein NVS89_03195 [Ancylobacter sp. MQZ15Z-1]|uniref:Uncharacterized protein n=1 Tax=Ancylobacter mangrovi TaxID=2972472 RepID=A0A9X2PB21_9HYPH|nr:hypothetical protein [Ancylobacter mangrovi]MCS0494089.1 hypothetical protein [Ancylobacter mangrovi]